MLKQRILKGCKVESFDNDAIASDGGQYEQEEKSTNVGLSYGKTWGKQVEKEETELLYEIVLVALKTQNSTSVGNGGNKTMGIERKKAANTDSAWHHKNGYKLFSGNRRVDNVRDFFIYRRML
ncbi:hypothetical protein Ancab_014737 [Ancistrocladus abbreviatus]